MIIREGELKVWLTLFFGNHDGVSFKIPNSHEREKSF